MIAIAQKRTVERGGLTVTLGLWTGEIVDMNTPIRSRGHWSFSVDSGRKCFVLPSRLCMAILNVNGTQRADDTENRWIRGGGNRKA